MNIADENHVKCILAEGNDCPVKVALRDLFNCEIPRECDYFSLLESCNDSYEAIMSNKKFREEYPDGS
jgi:hypothetical protein